MRKLLILIVVLGMASAAYAGFSISVHEVGGAEYDGHPLAPTDYLWLDIDATSATPAEYTYWALVVETAEGSITGGVVGASPPAGNLNGLDTVDYITPYFIGYGPVSPTAFGVSGVIGDSGGLTLNGTQFDEILFHCLDEVDAVVELWLSPDYTATFSLADTVVIPQIPEPMTLALLGLGGLLLRRRK